MGIACMHGTGEIGATRLGDTPAYLVFLLLAFFFSFFCVGRLDVLSRVGSTGTPSRWLEVSGRDDMDILLGMTWRGMEWQEGMAFWVSLDIRFFILLFSVISLWHSGSGSYHEHDTWI
jgi:hypothetical protein